MNHWVGLEPCVQLSQKVRICSKFKLSSTNTAETFKQLKNKKKL